MSKLGSIVLMLASTIAVVDSLRTIPSSLREAAMHDSLRIPNLQKKSASLKRELNQKLISNAEVATDSRSLQDNGYMYQWDPSMSQAQLGFDITEYSVKYTQCATIQAYSDTLAEDESSASVLEAKRFAIFRLCPSNVCSNSSHVGCTSDYGEYLVSMDQFLVSMLEYQEQHVVGYCEYCQQCATVEAVKAFFKTIETVKANCLTIAESNYETWRSTNNDGGDDKDAQLAYYNYLQNGGNSNSNYNSNYASNYANKYYYYNKYSSYSNNNNNANNNNNNAGSSYDASQYSWDNEQMWNIQANGETAWQSMGQYGASGTYFGKKVLNGYIDGNGDFVEQWGYFDSSGNYVSIEQAEGDDHKDEDEAVTEFVWDEELYGAQPSGWSNYDADSSSCNYVYASSCFNQYSACMAVLESEANKNSGYSNVKGSETLLDFIECTEVTYNANNGVYEQYTAQQMSSYYSNRRLESQRYFIGPHCGSNGRDITLAVYSDPYCSMINTNVTVSGLLGTDPLAESDLIPSGCLGCSANEYDVWYEGDNVDGIQPFCSMLYQVSGKCNSNLKASDYSSWVSANQQQTQQEEQRDGEQEAAEEDQSSSTTWKQIYQSATQQGNEQAVCSFIAALTSSTYDENGEISMGNNSPYWNLPAPSQWGAALKTQTAKVSIGMKIALSIMGLAVVIMAIIVCFLQGQLARKNIPWRPRRSKGEDPTDIARQNSGITMGRSRSGLGAAPLI